jgi:hypothetical protein
MQESPAQTAANQALAAAARATAEALIEARANKFALRPSLLDVIEAGLAARSPRKMRARILELIDEELTMPRRYFGFGGEIPLMNLNAAERYAARLIELERVRA